MLIIFKQGYLIIDLELELENILLLNNNYYFLKNY